ncbi:hypothetical protein NON20_11555 [Synechocystis sp. B12]|nr:hypothetical protein NON20_11555 [Synechocystis sp. B12]
MVISSRPLSGLNGVLSRLFIANTLAFLGLFGGMVPEVSWQPTALVFRWSAYSQEFSPESINHYAKAVLAIEVERKKPLRKFKPSLVGFPPTYLHQSGQYPQVTPQRPGDRR